MKLLSGTELAGFIKERQARQVRGLRQADGVLPKLAIVQTSDNPVIDTYVHLKQRYGEDVLVEVEVVRPSNDELFSTIERLNTDESVHGIIIQLPLADESQTEEAVNLVAPEKDVDGLGQSTTLTPATAMAIDWLMAGYNIDLKRPIAIIGNGRLVGAPLAKLWRGGGYDVNVYDRTTEDLTEAVKSAEIIVSAAGAPNLITSEMVSHKAVVVDAGTSAEHGVIVGDVAPEVYDRDDIAITPQKGGVGPLTVCALFDNVIRAARTTANIS